MVSISATEAVPSAALPSSTPTRRRLYALDGLRFIAAVAVVGFHYTGIKTPFWGSAPSAVFPTLNEVTRYGYLGVELFFMISGFVILLTAWNRPITRFTASRVARLFPAYWAAVLLTVILQHAWRDGRTPSVLESLMNFTMVQEAWDVLNVQGAFWTLWIELKFYLLIGVFILVGITRRRVIAVTVLWPLLSQLAKATDADLLSSLLVSTYAPFFALGMVLFLLYRDGSSTVVWLAAAFNLILCLRYSIGHAESVSESVGQHVSPDVVAVLVVAMAVLLWACTAGPLSRIGWKRLSLVGALTYPLYLVHGQFGFFVIDTLHSSVPAYVVLVLAVALSLALAVALHYLVERRFHDRLRDAVARGLEDEHHGASTRR